MKIESLITHTNNNTHSNNNQNTGFTIFLEGISMQ